MGRPPGPPEKVRRNRIGLTVTDAELEQLGRLADEAGLPLGTLLYGLVKQAVNRKRTQRSGA